MARLDAIPDPVRTHFSKRTLGGEEAARAYAKELGLDWDTLTPQRRAGLLKAGTQGTAPGLDGTLREKLRKDDMADFADWRRQAETSRLATMRASRPTVRRCRRSLRRNGCRRPTRSRCPGWRRSWTTAP